MISNGKIGLLKSWENNIFGELGIAEIMKISGKKTKTWVFNSIKQLEKNGLLASKKKGNLNLYLLNLDNPFLIQLLQYLELQGSLGFPQMGIIQETISRVREKNYCLAIFGSYAAGKQSKNSDLDICFLIGSKDQEKKIRPYFNEVKLDFPLEVDEHYITFEEFVKMLLAGEENLGKQIFRKHKIFYNADIFYQLVKEAHKNGFKQ